MGKKKTLVEAIADEGWVQYAPTTDRRARGRVAVAVVAILVAASAVILAVSEMMRPATYTQVQDAAAQQAPNATQR